jgi:hypothetical protein
MPPHPDPLPRGGEERRKMKRFKQCILTLALSRGMEREGKNLTAPLTLVLSRGMEREGKNLTAPLTLVLSRKGREE